MTWNDRIEQAKQVGEFNMDDKFAASDWRSCAISELSIEYSQLGEPIDKQLFQFGKEFTNCVFLNKIELAEDCYNQIQLYSYEFEIEQPEFLIEASV